MKDHAELAEVFNKDEQRVDWHDETLWFVREKRDKASHQIPDWEELREAASQIKHNALSDLGNYLEQFEKNAIANGITVHWAMDAKEHNEIVHSLLKKHGITQMVKSKSMLTEECHLNHYLEEQGINVVDSDLGELIVQLAKEPPSHIVLPCIHKRKEEIGDIFYEHLGSAKGESDPQILTETARIHLRNTFLTRKAALTGVNFAVAETGEFVVCTNEGNADMGAHLSDIHIASMGIEKLIPKRKDLGVFLRLLTRSATGQPITTYSSHFKRPRPGQEMHIVLVDNGRSIQLGREDFRNSLKCIRCGACMNTCPVYRRSGGHSYHTAVAGPIGSILAPNLDMKQYADLPFASTLCGSCTNVCPVKIDIHEQLYKWRQVIVKEGYSDKKKTVAMHAMAYTLSSPKVYRLAGKVGRVVMKYAPFALNNGLNPWYKHRDMPEPPKESFGEWYRKNRR
ncbi:MULTISPECIES: lactate utilization protein B [unclassified Mucilaginibacter]|uniref:lactate utilization protein B n=1 Tax=unclassified Mucilaginibacter TaxID=2617802 RepID=UPI002AC9216F|nr:MULTISPECIES: lactate utilization protein B [unclassified Mucilaginibacter]MEB0248826.1 lactate utilization protein B [Mucilaginibacter sp. 5B2]MEB0263256.1 lactate utilization protein B [Mucilaginibacter sp. 10I4]MEB0280831.1 lactate utilization protein B [Mucilaginibacter sp. 10B2]MEB0302302.1 lactate utilization protein B [Mucilaginibacter sp. 5C4]WPX21709.1 lactate utilization protein B [Mucilaginibacter sp. 5C4]